MQRRHRLSRSRDFDTVYRHGRSVSTRYLVLYWFAREDGPEAAARLGLAFEHREVGGKQVSREGTGRFFGAPAVQALGSRTPEPDPPVEAAREDRDRQQPNRAREAGSCAW